MTDDAAWPLAQHVCRTSYADLPASAVESARRDIVDTFGCMLGGGGSPGIGELCAVISRPIYGGGSDAAIGSLAPHVDVFMLWGEPLKDTALFMERVRAEAALTGRNPTFSLSTRPDPGGNGRPSLGPGQDHP